MHTEEHWTERAACRGADPELFFPLELQASVTEHIDAAKAVCARCPVAASCLDWALRSEAYGVWGGTTPDERRELRRTRQGATLARSA